MSSLRASLMLGVTGARDELAKTVERHFDEVEMALIGSRIMVKIAAVRPSFGLEFFRFGYQSLFNDRIARATRIFDKRKDARNFWRVEKDRPALVRDALVRHSIDRPALVDFADRLKHVRDNTIAHISLSSVLDSRSIWQRAGIKAIELQKALMAARRVFSHVYRAEFGVDFPEIDYRAADVRPIIKAGIEAGIID